MRAMIELPDAVYRESERIAKSQGFTLEQLIVHALTREVSQQKQDSDSKGRVTLPLIQSNNPGTLDLSNFDFDDLLA
jgi:hypothetical protein